MRGEDSVAQEGIDHTEVEGEGSCGGVVVCGWRWGVLRVTYHLNNSIYAITER